MAVALLEEFGAADVRERDEAWRYSKTALRALSQNDFALADGDAPVAQNLRDRFEWPATQRSRIVFVNGVFADALSDLTAIAAAVSFERSDNSHSTLTIAGDVAEPVHVVYLHVPGSVPVRWSGSLDVVVKTGSAQLIEHHLGESGAEVLGALASNWSVAAQASLQATTVCDLPESVSLYRRLRTSVSDGAKLDTTHVLLGSRLQRHDIVVDLAGKDSRFDSRGVFALIGRQHVDTQMKVTHSARDTACDIVWRGIADERSRGIFHGAITVARGADGADAQLSNKNLLLSAQAEIDTQPVLEIYADEVKAAHGATVGQLDERALFYLRSRGIGIAEARRMLVGAFSTVAIERVPQSWLREQLLVLLARRIGGGGA